MSCRSRFSGVALLLIIVGTVALAAPATAAGRAPTPDLARTVTSWTGFQNSNGEWLVRIEETILNQGDADAGRFILSFRQVVYRNDGSSRTYRKYRSIDHLAVGRKTHVQATFRCVPGVFADSTIKIDPARQVADQDRSNNNISDEDIYCYTGTS